MTIQQVDMISNGNFENGTLENWTSQNVQVESSIHLTGAFSAMFDGVSNAFLTQVMPWEAGATASLTFSATAMMDTPGSTPGLIFNLYYLDVNNNLLAWGFNQFIAKNQLPLGLMNAYKNLYAVASPAPLHTTQAVLNINNIPLHEEQNNVPVIVDDIQLLAVTQIL
ncbi:NTTRR-F1 domain [Longirhabdus pacifica]|uniref:NTTRR-F1 domain n=1 Tax=Longirhabdus pacifica TaxID=2305227 RepID=UPI0010092907|nr:NTTRR-F1 domain [Longirhabdus pacifica]